MEIGTLLKETREEKGLTLDNIQEKTKIQKRYLVAIEQGDYKALPGKFYARAFIREYAEAVELDPDVVVANLKEDIEVPEEKPVKYTRLDRTEKFNENNTSSILSFLPTLIVILLIVAIVGVAVMYYQKSLSESDGETVKNDGTDEIVTKESDNDDEDETDTDTEEKETDEDKKEESKDEPEFKVVEEGTGNSPESTLELEDVGDEVIVEVTTSNETYLEVRDDNDKSYFADMLTSNSTETEFDLSGQERIYFNVGNASGVTIKINGTELEFPVDPIQSVHQKLWVNLK